MIAVRPRLLRFDHVQLAMPPGREDKARAFYGEVLGLDEEPKPPVLARRGGLWFSSGALRLHLGVEADFRPARKAHPALEVADIDALVERLQRAGGEIVWDDSIEGTRRFHTHDPFGNRLEFVAGGEGSKS